MIVPIVKCGDCRVKNNNLLPVQVFFFLGGGDPGHNKLLE